MMTESHASIQSEIAWGNKTIKMTYDEYAEMWSKITAKHRELKVTHYVDVHNLPRETVEKYLDEMMEKHRDRQAK
jgi:hypothetical protein